MSHSKTPYSPNFPSNMGYSPPPNNEKSGNTMPYPTAPYPQPTAPVSAMPVPFHNTAPYPVAQSNIPPYPVVGAPSYGSPMQMEPGFKPAYQPSNQPSASPGNPPLYQHQPAPITHQPASAPGGWMSIPQGVPNCPPGLEYLCTIDQLLIRQKVELLEAFIGFETNNKYTVMNNIGQKMYYAVEENDCCTRMFCGPLRPFDIKIFDNHRNEVIRLYRPLACESCCFPCCLQKLEVFAPPGRVVGTVEQEWSLCKPSFVLRNEAGEIVLRIRGPLCRFSFCGDVKFNVYSKDGETKVGKIRKQWSGLAREMFTDSDYFGITFPMDLDVKMKATLLGACFLIDYMFFEKSGNRESDGAGML